jgi:hypothetical protein
MSNSKSVANSAKDILLERITESVTISRDAVVSGGWSYPFLGILYFASHPSLYRAVAPILIKCVLASFGITLGLFIFAYLPQVAFCALFSGPFAFITAAVMVLGEAYAIILVVSKAFFLGQAQDQICALHTLTKAACAYMCPAHLQSMQSYCNKGTRISFLVAER